MRAERRGEHGAKEGFTRIIVVQQDEFCKNDRDDHNGDDDD
jgi:hypothetical protein